MNPVLCFFFGLGASQMAAQVINAITATIDTTLTITAGFDSTPAITALIDSTL